MPSAGRYLFIPLLKTRKINVSRVTSDEMISNHWHTISSNCRTILSNWISKMQKFRSVHIEKLSRCKNFCLERCSNPWPFVWELRTLAIRCTGCVRPTLTISFIVQTVVLISEFEQLTQITQNKIKKSAVKNALNQEMKSEECSRRKHSDKNFA